MDYIEKNIIIPIVFASDNNFAPYTGVAVKSIIENASINYSYHIYVLYNELCIEYIQNI